MTLDWPIASRPVKKIELRPFSPGRPAAQRRFAGFAVAL